MPVHLRPDELAELPQTQVREREEESVSLIGEVVSAIHSAWIWMLLAVVALAAGLCAMKKTLIAMDKLRGQASASVDVTGLQWLTMWSPLIFFVLFGVGFGALLGWRLSMGDKIIWLTAGILGLLLVGVGLVTSAIIFPGGANLMCLIGLALVLVSTIAGAVFQTAWGG